MNPTLELAVDPACHSPGAYATSGNSSTSSLDSITTRHVTENGRRYHGFRCGRYLLPNDRAEQGMSSRASVGVGAGARATTGPILLVLGLMAVWRAS